MQLAKARPRDKFGRYVNLHHVSTGDRFGRLTVVRESEPSKISGDSYVNVIVAVLK